MYRIPLEILASSGDDRGASFSIVSKHLSTLLAVQDVHIASIQPGKIRGNHFHRVKTEIIAVIFSDKWSVHWDTGIETATHSEEYDGVGVALVMPPKLWSHAIRNDGANDLWIVAISEVPYSAEEAEARMVVSS